MSPVVQVSIVTYNSASVVGEAVRCSLAALENCDPSSRIVIVDNGSTDDTLAVVASADDGSGRLHVVANTNVGFGRGHNLAVAGQKADAFVIVNPDVRFDRNLLLDLCTDLIELPRAALVAPLLRYEDGAIQPSVRRFPPISYFAVRDALGESVQKRLVPFDYYMSAEPGSDPMRADWVVGALIAVSGRYVAEHGLFDPRFFLYFEDVDLGRMARERGWDVWVDPRLSAFHLYAQASRTRPFTRERFLHISSAAKYYAKYAGRALPGRVADHDAVLLPKCPEGQRVMTESVVSQDGRPDPAVGGAILMPAHNEGAVIARSLNRLLDGLDPSVRVVVVCNGCTDDTADVARSMGPRVEVFELAQASKPAAIRAGEQAVSDLFPRLYVDADVDLTGAAANSTLRRLREGAVSARPPSVLHTEGVSPLLLRYYRARSRVPRVSTRLWGAGVYGLSALGRSRFDEFPEVVADDLFVDQLFTAQEIEIVGADPVVVRTPRTLEAQLRLIRRGGAGNRRLEQCGHAEPTAGETARAVLGSAIAGPQAALDAAVFVGVTLIGRLQTRTRVVRGWERDDTSRAPHDSVTP